MSPVMESYDDEGNKVEGQSAEPAEGVTGPEDMLPQAPVVPDAPRPASYDQDVKDRQEEQLAEAREYRRDRLGQNVPSQPEEPESYVEGNTDRVPDFEAEEQNPKKPEQEPPL